MLRAIAAAIAGYIAAVIVAFGGLSLAWALFGPNGSFEPASWETSVKWNLTNAVIGIITAIVAGYVCALISPGGRALGILIGLVVVLGVLTAVATMMKPEMTEPRPAVVTMVEAMSNATAPLWAALLSPILGVIGVIIGSRLRGRPSSATSPS